MNVRKNLLQRQFMSIYQLKPAFQQFLRPMVSLLASKGVTANQVTIFATLLSIVTSIYLYSIGPSIEWLLLPIAMFIRMALNAIDGMLAREFDMQSSLGFVLNELGDLVSDAAIYLSIVAITGFHVYGVFLFVLLAWLSEIIAILSQQVKQERANHGPLGKSDRAFLFGVLGLLIAIDVDFSTIGIWILMGGCCALLVTIYRRLKTVI